MMTMTDAQAAQAMREHHAEMERALRQRVAALGAAVQARAPHGDAHRAVVEYLQGELLPHAMAEEKALYPAGEKGETTYLVRAMIAEHRNLVAHIGAFADAFEPVQAASQATAILALFESHLAKENDLLIPSLVADPEISLSELLGGMHELLG